MSEEVCIDKRLNAVSEGAENLFYRMLVKADDAGNVFADPVLVRNQMYPRRDITLREAEDRIMELHNKKGEHGKGLIDIYYMRGDFYAHFPGFRKHQILRKDIIPRIIYPVYNDLASLHKSATPFSVAPKTVKPNGNSGTIDYLGTENVGTLYGLFGHRREKVMDHLRIMRYDDEAIDGAIKAFEAQKQVQ